MKTSDYSAVINKYLTLIDDDEIDFLDVGIRFENKVRVVGETCGECSKHNADRDDDREFPDFDGEGYADMDELDGLSAWLISSATSKSLLGEFSSKFSIEQQVGSAHCYIVASNRDVTHDDCDEGEIVMQNPVVLEVLF